MCLFLGTDYGCFCATKAELRSCERPYDVEWQNIYLRKNLLTWYWRNALTWLLQLVINKGFTIFVSGLSLCVCMLSHFSHVWLFATLWTIACQVSLSMGFPRQKYWNRLPFPSPGDLPDPGIEPASPALAGRFPLSHLGTPLLTEVHTLFWFCLFFPHNLLLFQDSIQDLMLDSGSFGLCWF